MSETIHRIEARMQMLADVGIKQDRRDRDLVALLQVAKAAKALDACVCEFPDDQTCCAEAFQALHDALRAMDASPEASEVPSDA